MPLRSRRGRAGDRDTGGGGRAQAVPGRSPGRRLRATLSTASWRTSTPAFPQKVTVVVNDTGKMMCEQVTEPWQFFPWCFCLALKIIENIIKAPISAPSTNSQSSLRPEGCLPPLTAACVTSPFSHPPVPRLARVCWDLRLTAAAAQHEAVVGQTYICDMEQARCVLSPRRALPPGACADKGQAWRSWWAAPAGTPGVCTQGPGGRSGRTQEEGTRAWGSAGTSAGPSQRCWRSAEVRAPQLGPPGSRDPVGAALPAMMRDLADLCRDPLTPRAGSAPQAASRKQRAGCCARRSLGAPVRCEDTFPMTQRTHCLP